MKKKSTGKLSLSQQRLLFRFSVALVVCAVLGVFFSPYGGIYSLYQKKSHLAILEAKIVEFQDENKELSQEIARLQGDSEYIKEIARKKHGLLKKNERVYDFSRK